MQGIPGRLDSNGIGQQAESLMDREQIDDASWIPAPSYGAAFGATKGGLRPPLRGWEGAGLCDVLPIHHRPISDSALWQTPFESGRSRRPLIIQGGLNLDEGRRSQEEQESWTPIWDIWGNLRSHGSIVLRRSAASLIDSDAVTQLS